jgi:hypothetical protein
VSLTPFGVIALTFMMSMSALERRHRGFVAAFALGCALSSAYGFASGVWPRGVVEAVWTIIAVRRYQRGRERPVRPGLAGEGSNLQPSDPKSAVLPVELPAKAAFDNLPRFLQNVWGWLMPKRHTRASPSKKAES